MGLFGIELPGQQRGSLFGPSASSGTSSTNITVTGGGGKPTAQITPIFEQPPQSFVDLGFDSESFNALRGGLSDADWEQFLAETEPTLAGFQTRFENIDTSIANIEENEQGILNDPLLLQYEEALSNRANPDFDSITDAMLGGERAKIQAAINTQIAAGEAGLRRRGLTDSGLGASLEQQSRLAGSGQLSNMAVRQEIANVQERARAEENLFKLSQYKAAVSTGAVSDINQLQMIREIPPEAIHDILSGARTIEDANEIMDLMQREFDLQERELDLAEVGLDAYIESLDRSFGERFVDAWLGIVGGGTDFGTAAAPAAALSLLA